MKDFVLTCITLPFAALGFVAGIIGLSLFSGYLRAGQYLIKWSRS